MPRYSWQITFRNDKMGFSRRFIMRADDGNEGGFETIYEAIGDGIERLVNQGYDPGEFRCIEAIRSGAGV